MLKETDVKLDLLTDIEMFKMVESGIRGGILQISHRHAIANNKYMSNYNTSNNKETMMKLANKFVNFDGKIKTDISTIIFVIKTIINRYNKLNKRNIVDDLCLENIEYKYNTNLILVDYKLHFKTNTNENIIFNMMKIIFYNNTKLNTFEIRINCYTDDRGMEHKIIANDTEN